MFAWASAAFGQMFCNACREACPLEKRIEMVLVTADLSWAIVVATVIKTLLKLRDPPPPPPRDLFFVLMLLSSLSPFMVKFGITLKTAIDTQNDANVTCNDALEIAHVHHEDRTITENGGTYAER